MENIFIDKETIGIVKYVGESEQELFKRFGRPFITFEKGKIYFLPLEYAERLLKVYNKQFVKVEENDLTITIKEVQNVGKTGKCSDKNKT